MVNISEGRALEVVAAIAMLAGPDLLDVHSDPDHNRSVITTVGTTAPRDIARGAITALDINDHAGVHPRLGVVDVVPFVPLDGSNFADAVAARDEFAAFVADEFDVPCFLYGTGRTLPQLRKDAFTHLRPDVGPSAPHPTAGAICVGAREVLVAYNVILADSGITTAREIASKLRSQHVRALGMEISAGAQVSMNLIAPTQVGPAEVFDMISEMAQIDQCELVGLIPANVLQQIPKNRWNALDLTAEKTIEWQLAARNRRLTEN